jgi:hypothetical protein
MGIVTLPVPEEQVVEWTTHLSPVGKRQVLSVLIPDLARFEALVDYGSARIHKLCAERSIDWDSLTEEARERLVDDLLHEE